MKIQIKEETDNATINLAVDTIRLGKQALIFVNTKSSAEKTAEEIAKKIKEIPQQLQELSDEILHALARPTKQCEREAICIKKGIAFHHAGLTAKQRELIEQNFKRGVVRIICSTPTLAAGLDLPAYRAIIKDLRRYTARGLAWIPVLEYHQMCGRAGRPNYDTEGQAIVIAQSTPEKKKIHEHYLLGNPEEIYSKLAVEPALRMYILTLIATGFTKTRSDLHGFFSKTFYAHQFKDMRKITSGIGKIIAQLSEWEFIIKSGDEFTNANELQNETYHATLLGKRVAELYLDPLTAHHFIECLRSASDREVAEFSFLQAIANTLELRPLLRVGIREHDAVSEQLMKYATQLLTPEPSMYDPEYEDFLNSVKTALMFIEWLNEKDEEYLLEQFSVRPGELRAKLERADWLIYAVTELAKILSYQHLLKHLMKLRIRLEYGIKEELVQLIRLKGIGRVRARMLFKNNIKTISDVSAAGHAALARIVGEKLAQSIREQVEGPAPQSKESLADFEKDKP